MMTQHSQHSVFVVVEGDAACPFWMDHWGDAPEGEWSMLEQEEWETAPSFARRLDDVLGRIEANGELTVVLVTGARTDPMALAARWELSTRLMSHLAQDPGDARLVVTRGFAPAKRTAGLLAELADDLAEAFEDAAEVVLALGDEAPSSGLRTWAPPPNAAASDVTCFAAE